MTTQAVFSSNIMNNDSLKKLTLEVLSQIKLSEDFLFKCKNSHYKIHPGSVIVTQGKKK